MKTPLEAALREARKAYAILKKMDDPKATKAATHVLRAAYAIELAQKRYKQSQIGSTGNPTKRKRIGI